MSLSDDELKKFWEIANQLRKNLDAAEYKHIVLGLVFLKYVSDSFEDRKRELLENFSDPKSSQYKQNEKARENALNERDYYKEVNVFWVPEQSRWSLIQQNAKQPDLANKIDNALYEIERENPKLEGIVQRNYADAKLPVADLGAVVDMISSINYGKDRTEASDVLGQVYEYFLGNFANAEGKLGGQFYTTPSIVKTLVEVLQPLKGRVYDPACGSGGMFVQSERFVEAHGGKLGQIAIYGQESNPTTRRLCAMNLAIRGIDFDLGKSHGDTFTEDQHKDLKFDFIMMNPPFGKNASYPKEELEDDVRWKKYGVPRKSPANFAWMSHAIHHLAPKGRAGIVMPRGTLTSSQGGDDKIRKAMLDDDVLECIIDLPGQLFFNVAIPSCLWFFNKDKSKWKNDRTNNVLVIDASSLGKQISKTQIEFSDDDIKRIYDAFESWANGEYEDQPGFCTNVDIEQIKKNEYSLAVNRYVIKIRSVSETSKLAILNWNHNVDEIQRITKDVQLLDEVITLNLRKLGIHEYLVKPYLRATSSLEDVVQALYKSWFIDFDPTTNSDYFENKANLSYLSSAFGSEFESSELGDIPKGWRIETLGKLAEVVDCLHSKKPQLIDKGFPYLQLDTISDKGILLFNLAGKISEVDYKLWTSRIEVETDDILITNVGRVGAVALVPNGFQGAIGRNITAIRPSLKSLYSPYLITALLNENFRDEINYHTDGGTVMDALNVRNIPKMRFVVAPEIVHVAFAEFVTPIKRQIENVYRLNILLGEISGEPLNRILNQLEVS